MTAENRPEVGVSGEQLQQARVALNSLHRRNRGIAQIPEEQVLQQLQLVADLPEEGLTILRDELEGKKIRNA